MSKTLMQASHQWMTRPADERFISLDEMKAFKRLQREECIAKGVSSRKVEAVADENDIEALRFIVDEGREIEATNWSFGQVASLAGAPGGYMRKLPAPLAADCINYGLHVSRDIEDVGILIHEPSPEISALSFNPADGTFNQDAPTVTQVPTLRAATGPTYGRIWDVDILDNLTKFVGDGVTGDWRVPGEFGKPVAVNRQNTTLYASDRDMFVFLADEKNLVEFPDRRNGKPGLMSRGFFMWNSEVGSKTFGISTFLFDYVCMNRIVWGAEDVQTIKIRHSSGAPDRFLEEAVPALEDYQAGSTSNIVEAISAAKAKRIDVETNEFLAKRQFNRSMIKRIMETHEAEEGRPIETLWDATTAITAVARQIPHQAERVEMERAGGAILDLVK